MGYLLIATWAVVVAASVNRLSKVPLWTSYSSVIKSSFSSQNLLNLSNNARSSFSYGCSWYSRIRNREAARLPIIVFPNGIKPIIRFMFLTNLWNRVKLFFSSDVFLSFFFLRVLPSLSITPVLNADHFVKGIV